VRLGTPHPSGHLHLTLAITEDHDVPPKVQMDRMARIPGELWLRSFDLSLDRLTGGEGSLALCPSDKPSQLKLLQRQLRKTLALSGIRRAGWRFNPHVTLLYRKGPPFSQPVAPISWRVDELVLVHSHVGLTRHDIVRRWPLLSGNGAGLAA
jgi:2'-5' RNA ligase